VPYAAPEDIARLKLANIVETDLFAADACQASAHDSVPIVGDALSNGLRARSRCTPGSNGNTPHAIPTSTPQIPKVVDVLLGLSAKAITPEVIETAATIRKVRRNGSETNIAPVPDAVALTPAATTTPRRCGDTNLTILSRVSPAKVAPRLSANPYPFLRHS